jgi:hypothetical protein
MSKVLKISELDIFECLSMENFQVLELSASTSPTPQFFFVYSYVHTMFGLFLPPTAHSPPPPRFQTETVLPLSLILLKRQYKQ